MRIAYFVFALLTVYASATRADEPAAKEPPSDKEFLYEIVRHLYRWHLDERDLENVTGETDLTFQAWLEKGELDPDDNSDFAVVVLTDLQSRVLLKRPDYSIEETGVRVYSDRYKIYRVERNEPEDPVPASAKVVTLDMQEMRDYLFRTRSQTEFPGEALTLRLRKALRAQMLSGSEKPTTTQTVYIAPLSPVANECWVYWENQKLLIRFSSDIDLTNEEFWQHEKVVVNTWDTLNQVIVSPDEAPGSNVFKTRDQIGRALYNCLVLGKREDLVPLAQTE